MGRIILRRRVSAPVLVSLDYDLADTAGGDVIEAVVDHGVEENAEGFTATVGGVSAPIVDSGSDGPTRSLLRFEMPSRPSGMHDVVVTPVASGVASNPLQIKAWSPSEIAGADTVLRSDAGWTILSGVGTWACQVSARTWSSATPPTLVPNVFGKRPALRFDGLARLVASVARDFHTEASSVYVVAKWTSDDEVAAHPNYNVPLNIVGWQGGWCGFGASAGSVRVVSFNASGATPRVVTGTSTTLNDGLAHLIGADNDAAQNVKLWVDGASEGTNGPMRFYGWDVIGVGLGPQDGFIGDVGLILLVQGGVISTQDLADLHKWARVFFRTVP